MREYPQLHIFGYTARDEEHDREIFTKIMVMNTLWPDRCSIRYSRKEPGYMHAVVIKSKDDILPRTIACPAQTEETECCATCALCWSPAAREKTIAFIEHGPTTKRHGHRKIW